MISDEELLRLNKEGFIPGPIENEDFFLKRVDLSKKLVKDPKSFFENEKQNEPFDLDSKILKPRWNWTRAQLYQLFDMAPNALAIYYSDVGLSFFQAAATWLVNVGNDTTVPVLQFRKRLNKKTYLWIYTLDEILAHEAVHAARIAFNEPKTEEIFSYMTASSIFRRQLGPIIRSTNEVIIFFGLISLSILSQSLFIMLDKNIFSFFWVFFGFCSIVMFSMGLFRLFLIKRKVNKTYRRLKKILKDKQKAKFVLFRLTDKEISMFSKLKKEDIRNYFSKNKDTSLRHRLINLSYFQ